MTQNPLLISERLKLRAEVNFALSEFRNVKIRLSGLNSLTNSDKEAKEVLRKAYSATFGQMNRNRGALIRATKGLYNNIYRRDSNE